MQVRLPGKLYVLMFAVLIAAILGAYFAYLRDVRRQKLLTVEAAAKIIKTNVRHSVDPETGMQRIEDTVVTFEYEIDGRKYERTTRVGKIAATALTPWGDAKVCYDPSDAKTIDNAELFPKGYVCGSGQNEDFSPNR